MPEMSGGAPKKHSKVLRDNIQSITSNALGRMALKAGLPRIGGLIYEEVRGCIRHYMEDIVKAAVIYSDHQKRATVMIDDVLHAIELNGFTKQYEVEGPIKPCKISEKKKIHTKIREYQKQSDCYYLAKAGFDRLVREIASDFKNDLRFSADALINIQMHIESYVIKLFKDAGLAMIHAGRVTLQPKDIQMARHLTKGCKSHVA
jgi:histone H3/H4